MNKEEVLAGGAQMMQKRLDTVKKKVSQSLWREGQGGKCSREGFFFWVPLLSVFLQPSSVIAANSYKVAKEPSGDT